MPNDGQHRDNSAHSPNGQRSVRHDVRVTNATPAYVGQRSGGEIQQGRTVPPTNPSADTIIHGTGDSSEGGYGPQTGPGADKD